MSTGIEAVQEQEIRFVIKVATKSALPFLIGGTEESDWRAHIHIKPEVDALWLNLPDDYSRRYGYHTPEPSPFFFPFPFPPFSVTPLPLRIPSEIAGMRAFHGLLTTDPEGKPFRWSYVEGSNPDIVLTRTPLAERGAYLALPREKRIELFMGGINTVAFATRTRQISFEVRPLEPIG